MPADRARRRAVLERDVRPRPPGPADLFGSLTGAFEAGLHLPAAIEHAAAGLPTGVRDVLEQAARRLQGDYAEDEWGFDEQYVELVYPLFELMYERWWRVTTTGVMNIPSHGRALLVANHAGVLPWDATMMSVGILKEHPIPRHSRFMVLDWAFRLPFASSFMRRVGGVPASPFNAGRLLEQEHLVMVFPEGTEGRRQAILGALPASAFRPRRICRSGSAGFGADRPGCDRRLGGDLPEDRRLPAPRPVDRLALLSDHADVPGAWPLWRGTAAVEVADRVLPADRPVGVWAGSGRGPLARPRALRARARDDPGEALREPGETGLSLPLRKFRFFLSRKNRESEGSPVRSACFKLRAGQ